jgi:cytochrome c-type biogenesis protein CcmE
VSPGEEAPPSLAPLEAKAHRARPALRLAVVAAVISLAVGFLLIKGLGSSLDYFKTVKEALAQKQSLGTTVFRLEGTVVPGSVQHTKLGAAFELSSGSSRVQVINTGSPPQLFAPSVPVVVVGHFSSASSSTFESNQIMVKHSSSYIAAHPSRVRSGNGSVR